MNEKRILTINKADGTSEQVEEVISFEFDDTKKQYLVYTKNEVDETGNMTIYVTEVKKDNDGYKFLGVSTDDEWDRIKAVLRTLIKKEM
ncbi:MAG: DUF1292 domain-containing protein [Firmicutes bacterium]|nr:DUF1292 domain-containing protein [Bacillota bacterium]